MADSGGGGNDTVTNMMGGGRGGSYYVPMERTHKRFTLSNTRFSQLPMATSSAPKSLILIPWFWVISAMTSFTPRRTAFSDKGIPLATQICTNFAFVLILQGRKMEVVEERWGW